MVLYIIMQYIISFIIVCFIGYVVWRMYFNKRNRKRYFYVSFYTTKKTSDEFKIIFGGKIFITSDGLYLNKNKTLKRLAETVDPENGIVMLNIIELKEDDFHSFTD